MKKIKAHYLYSCGMEDFVEAHTRYCASGVRYSDLACYGVCMSSTRIYIP